MNRWLIHSYDLDIFIVHTGDLRKQSHYYGNILKHIPKYIVAMALIDLGWTTKGETMFLRASEILQTLPQEFELFSVLENRLKMNREMQLSR